MKKRTKPNWLDWISYRLFYWRWNPLLHNNRKLCRHFVECWNFWQEIESPERMMLRDWDADDDHATYDEHE